MRSRTRVRKDSVRNESAVRASRAEDGRARLAEDGIANGGTIEGSIFCADWCFGKFPRDFATQHLPNT